MCWFMRESHLSLSDPSGRRIVKSALRALIIASVVASAGLLAQAQSGQDTSTSVPELTSFHDVIMPMWHTAYPAKDYAALRKIAGDVDAGVAKIAKAKLPGILHEKEAAWAKGLTDLKGAAAAYVKAAAGKDDQALLAAAEKLHTLYEAQGQIIRPAVPEMNDFHQVLYVVQHTYVPEKKWAEVCKVSGDLQTKAEAIAKAALPRRVESKAEPFKKETAQLVSDAKVLAAACKANQAASIEKATTTLHARYEALTKIFE
jgi:hypothetical protein